MAIFFSLGGVWVRLRLTPTGASAQRGWPRQPAAFWNYEVKLRIEGTAPDAKHGSSRRREHVWDTQSVLMRLGMLEKCKVLENHRL